MASATGGAQSPLATVLLVLRTLWAPVLYLLPITEAWDKLRQTIPAFMPIPPPCYEDDRYTDRIDQRSLKQLTKLSRALGMEYVELDRFLAVWITLDHLRLGSLTMRQLSVQWHFRHSPLADALFAHCATSQREVADPLAPEANLPLQAKKKKKKKPQPSRPPTASTDNDDSDDDDDDSDSSDDDDATEVSSKPTTATSTRQSTPASTTGRNNNSKQKKSKSKSGGGGGAPAAAVNDDDQDGLTENLDTALPPRTVDTTELFMNLFEVCTLNSSEFVMLIFHSMNIAEPQDLPTPLRFTQRLVRLVYGPQPPVEVVQLMRCLRCLVEHNDNEGQEQEQHRGTSSFDGEDSSNDRGSSSGDNPSGTGARSPSSSSLAGLSMENLEGLEGGSVRGLGPRYGHGSTHRGLGGRGSGLNDEHNHNNNNLNGDSNSISNGNRNGQNNNYHSRQSTPFQAFKAARLAVRPILHDDETATVEERWRSVVCILLRFPIFVQPAFHLQRALIRKSMGHAFWQRLAYVKKALPLGNRRVGLPKLTPQAILAASQSLQRKADAEYAAAEKASTIATQHARFREKLGLKPLAAKNVVWELRCQAFDATQSPSSSSSSASETTSGSDTKSKTNNSKSGVSNGRNNADSSGSNISGSSKDGGSPAEIDPLWRLGAGYEQWCGLREVNWKKGPKWRNSGEDSDEDELFSDDDSDSDTSDEEEDGGDPKDAAANDTAAARSGSRPNTSGSSSSGAFGFRPNIVPMKTPREEASSLPSSWNDAVGAESKEEEEDLDEETGQLLREAQNLMKEDDDEEEDKKGGAKKGKGGDVENIDFKIGSDSQGERPGSGAWFYGKEPDEESTPLLQLWPPLGVVAEALTGAATTSTNHAWFLSASNLLLMVLDENQRMAPSLTSSTKQSASNFHPQQQGREDQREGLIISQQRPFSSSSSAFLRPVAEYPSEPPTPLSPVPPPQLQLPPPTLPPSAPRVPLFADQVAQDNNKNTNNTNNTSKGNKSSKNTSSSNNSSRYCVSTEEALAYARTQLFEWYVGAPSPAPSSLSSGATDGTNADGSDADGNGTDGKKAGNSEQGNESENEQHKSSSPPPLHSHNSSSRAQHADLGSWFAEATLPSSNRINAMLTGPYRLASFALVERGGELPVPEVTYEPDDPRYRMEQERASGALPGSGAPQPFAPLIAPPQEFDSESGLRMRGASGGARHALGPRASLPDPATVTRVEQSVSRMTRSRAFAQFTLGASGVKRDSRLAKALSLVNDDKVLLFNLDRSLEDEVEPNDQAFWHTLTAEGGVHSGRVFYANIRTGAKQWTKPVYVRSKEKSKDDAYIRVW